jgi:hypothetical protein
MMLRGLPTKTFLHGKIAMDNGEVLVKPGYGDFIFRRGY